MTHLRLSIDGQTLMDGDLGQWKHNPPTAIQHLIKPGHKPEPYMQAALMALMEAAMRDVETSIEVWTKPTGWTVTVTHKAPIVVAT